MIKLYYFFKLVRFKNLIIIALTQLSIKFFLINLYLSNQALSNFNFSIYLFALISIVAGGYIINDIYDIKIDKINKPERRIIGNNISKKSAFRVYWTLNLIAILSGSYAAYTVNKFWLSIIFIYLAYSLWSYSKNYKTTFLIGNIQVAFLTALSIINLALYDLLPVREYNEGGSRMIFYIILVFAAFSFITTLIREIIKDIEDIEGDKKIYANTLAINYGIAKTRSIIASLILITSLGIGYFQYFQYSVLSSTFSIKLSYWGVNLMSVLYTSLIQILLIILLIKITKSNTKSDFHFSSTLCKIIMLAGILSIPLFSFLHIN